MNGALGIPVPEDSSDLEFPIQVDSSHESEAEQKLLDEPAVATRFLIPEVAGRQNFGAPSVSVNWPIRSGVITVSTR